MADLLSMERLNALPHPLWAGLGCLGEWPIHTIDVETGCLHIDVMGQLDPMHIGEVHFIMDSDWQRHEIDDFFIEDETNE